MISVESFRGRAVTEHRVEVVERKGTGHPDFICDSVMEAISIALSKEYKRQFGAILHHNIDKGLLAAGRTEKGFGGGRISGAFARDVVENPLVVENGTVTVPEGPGRGIALDEEASAAMRGDR